MKIVRIGVGAGFAGDRIEPAVELAERADIGYLVFECLAERTTALAQQARQRDPEAGFDPLLEARMRAVLPACRARGIRIVSNMGAANPHAAAARTAKVARSLGLTGLKVAAVTGDDVLDAIRNADYVFDDGAGAVAAMGNSVMSANAYAGVEGVVKALVDGADVVITGRVADPALFLAPLIHEFGWSMTDWNRLGRGTAVGHLMECAGQVTGGYFADPGFKDVPDLARLGFPIAEVTEDGDAIITKLLGTGGVVSAATCKEQLLYEVHDPAQYLQPDVVADFTGVTVEEVGPDRVAVRGGRGHPKTGLLKVTVGISEGYVGEGQISYGGPGALARGRLAQAIVAERLDIIGIRTTDRRLELIGVDSVLGPKLSRSEHEPREVRLRLACRTDNLSEAVRVGNEIESLYLCGPAGGGGVTKSVRETVGVRSTLVPEALVRSAVRMEIA